MTFKKKPPKKALAKLRDGFSLVAPIQEVINSALKDTTNDRTLEEYEAVGGDISNLKGDALYAYFDVQTGRQQRQIQHNNTELHETMQRISDLLNAHGFLANLQVDDPKTEREATFFRIIQECKGKEEDLKINVAEHINCHMSKAKHQYEAMKEIEQWFLDLLGEKTMEREFNNELAQIRFRHEENVIGQQNVEDALAKVASTVQKLRDIGYILVLSSNEGVGISEGPPTDREDTVTLLVPTEDGNDVRFHFTVILDDEAMFRDPKVQLLAQQYLKGMLFYGSAAKHKNRAQKRKVIRLMMRQLEAIYSFIVRLRNALTIAEKESNGYKSRVEELQLQKDQAYRDRERYRVQVEDADSILKKATNEKEVLRLANILLQDQTKQVERDLINALANASANANTRAKAADAQKQPSPGSGQAGGAGKQGKKSDTAGAPGTQGAGKTCADSSVIDLTASLSDVQVVYADHPPVDTENKEVQVGSLSMTVYTSRGLPTQQSLIGMVDVEVQPNLDALSSDGRIQLENAKEQVATYEDTVATLTGEMDEVKATSEELEKEAREKIDLVKDAEAHRAIEEAAFEKVRQLKAKAEEDRQEFLKKQKELDEEIAKQVTTILDLRALIAKQNVAIHSLRDHDTEDVGVTTETDISGTSVALQTDELTSREVKVELQKLKSGLAEFRRSIIGVLVEQNLIADIPSFPEQLRDTFNASSAAMEIMLDVKEHFGGLKNIISNAFDKINSNHQQAFQIVLAKKATEIESRIQGVDSSEEMRRVRLKLRQKVLDLEVDNSQMHDALKTLTKLIEEHRADYESQLDRKDERLLKQREENHRMKDLAWTLAEGLAKLRDEAVAKMPERRSLIDIMHLLQAVQLKLGRKLRPGEEGPKAAPRILVEGVALTNPSANPLQLPNKSRLDVGESRISLTGLISGVVGHGVTRHDWSPIEKERSMMRDKRNSPIRGLLEGAATNRGSSTSDRIARSALEYTNNYIDPTDGWTMRSTTREIIQRDDWTQTSDGTDDKGVPMGARTKVTGKRRRQKESYDGQPGGTQGAPRGTEPLSAQQSDGSDTGSERSEQYDEFDPSQYSVQEQEAMQRDGMAYRGRPRKHGARRRPPNQGEDYEGADAEQQPPRLDEYGRPIPNPGGGRTYYEDEVPGGLAHQYGPIGSQHQRPFRNAHDPAEHIHSSSLSYTAPFDLYRQPETVEATPELSMNYREPYAPEPVSGLCQPYIPDSKNAHPYRPHPHGGQHRHPPHENGGSSSSSDRGSEDNGIDISTHLHTEQYGPEHGHLPNDPNEPEYHYDLTDTYGVSHARDAIHTYFYEDDQQQPAYSSAGSYFVPDGYIAADSRYDPNATQPGEITDEKCARLNDQVTPGGYYPDAPGSRRYANQQYGPDCRQQEARVDGTHVGFTSAPGSHLQSTSHLISPTTAGYRVQYSTASHQRPFIPAAGFESSSHGNNPRSQQSCRGGSHSLSPQEQKEAARRASEEADAILNDMECHAARQVHNIRWSRVAAKSAVSAATQPQLITMVVAEPQLAPTTPFGRPFSPSTPVATIRTATSPPVVGRGVYRSQLGEVVPTETRQAEAYYLHQLAKLHQARMHMFEVRQRLATLESEVETNAQRAAAPTDLTRRKPSAPREEIPEEERAVDLFDHSEMTKESLEALRKETKAIKGDIKALQRGHKALVRRNTRSPDREDELQALQNQRQQAKFILQKREEQTRDARISQSRSVRRKKVDGFDQAIRKFVNNELEWQKALEEVDGRAGAEANTSTLPRFDPATRSKAFEAPRPTTAGPRTPSIITLLEQRAPPVVMTATGVGLGSPNSPRLSTAPGRPEDEASETRTETIHSKVPLKRKQPSLAELLDGSITRKLKYLKEQRLEQAVPRHTEKRFANPVIRTHRGEEPFEGPVDMAPYNFPQMGVIGRPVPQKLAKEARSQWDQVKSQPVRDGMTAAVLQKNKPTSPVGTSAVKEVATTRTTPVQTVT